MNDKFAEVRRAQIAAYQERGAEHPVDLTVCLHGDSALQVYHAGEPFSGILSLIPRTSSQRGCRTYGGFTWWR
jgi:hypothetical protein